MKEVMGDSEIRNNTRATAGRLFGTHRRLALIAFLLLWSVGSCAAPAPTRDLGLFRFEDDGVRVTILEGEDPVLVYNYGPVDPPEGVEERYRRSSYVHPLYGVDGDVLTQDFPEDHLHHRGVFWAWPECRIGETEFDLWALRGGRQEFREMLEQEVRAERAVMAVRNVWLAEGRESAVAEEIVRMVVHRAEEASRSVDFELTVRNLDDVPLSIRGRGETGYGGFNLRPDARRHDPQITTALGLMEKDGLVVDSAWADFSSRRLDDGEYSGVALFQHPGNPGYPHSGWILRYYGFLGASWPQYETRVLEPGEHLELRYRVYTHRGEAREAGVARVYEEYVRRAR